MEGAWAFSLLSSSISGSNLLKKDPNEAHAPNKMTVCEITLPVPPLLNRFYRISGKRLFKQAASKTFFAECWMIARKAKLKPVAYDVEVELLWYRQRKCGDIDAILKSLFDSLQNILWVNDSQIMRCTITKLHDKLNPRIELKMKKFDRKI